jgi:hypothetical protein
VGVRRQIILALKWVFFPEWVKGSGLSFRIDYGLKDGCKDGLG